MSKISLIVTMIDPNLLKNLLQVLLPVLFFITWDCLEHSVNLLLRILQLGRGSCRLNSIRLKEPDSMKISIGVSSYSLESILFLDLR
jgi:hypothetical protein